MTTPTRIARTRPARTDVRDRVLEAAHRTFLAKGYAETTITEIATTAGFTKGAVYSNFGSKPELFGQVCRSEFAANSSSVLAAVAPALRGTPTDELPASLAQTLAEVVVARGGWLSTIDEFRALAIRDVTISAVYTEVRGGQLTELTDILTEHQVLAAADQQAYREVAIIVLGQLTSLALEHAAAPRVITTDEINRSLVRLIRGLLS